MKPPNIIMIMLSVFAISIVFVAANVESSLIKSSRTKRDETIVTNESMSIVENSVNDENYDILYVCDAIDDGISLLAFL